MWKEKENAMSQYEGISSCKEALTGFEGQHQGRALMEMCVRLFLDYMLLNLDIYPLVWERDQEV